MKQLQHIFLSFLKSFDPYSASVLSFESITRCYLDLARRSKAFQPTNPDLTEIMTALLQTSITLEHKKPVVRNTLAASPYLDPEHFLDLDNLEPQSRLLALALNFLAPARLDYAICSYEQAFDWPTIFTNLASLAKQEQTAWKHQSFYVVEFRSKLKPSIDSDLLFTLDKQSHQEATESGGLLKYWYGSPDLERYNLATCECKPPSTVSSSH